MKVHEAIAAVMREVTHVEKGDRFSAPGAGTYNFRGVDRTVNALSSAMRKNGLVILPAALGVPEYKSAATSSGGTRNFSRVHVQYTIVGPEGDTLTGSAVGEAADSGDKGVSKAMSVAWRTFLLQTFFLPTDEPDPDSEVHDAVVGREAPGPRQAAQNGIVQHWDGRAKACRSEQELHALYEEAMKQRAPREALEAIKSYSRAGQS